MTIFYGWVSENEPERDPCHCGSARCRGFINFATPHRRRRRPRRDDRRPGWSFFDEHVVRARFEEYGAYLGSIGQEQVMEAITNTLARMKSRLGQT